MNLLTFLDLSYNPCNNFKFQILLSSRAKFSIFLFLPIDQGKIFLILRGGTCIPGLCWELPPPPPPRSVLEKSDIALTTCFADNEV